MEIKWKDDLFKLETFCGKSPMEIIESAQIIETVSGHFIIRAGTVVLSINDDNNMYISCGMTVIFNMDLNLNEWRMLNAMQDHAKKLYEEKLFNGT